MRDKCCLFGKTISTFTRYNSREFRTYSVQMFQYWAKQHPEKTAVEWWKGPQKADDQITYGELDQISRYIANVIVSKGLNVPHSSAKHKVSIIYIPRGIEMVVAMLAAHSAGLAFTIVDTEELTSDRVKYVWEDTSASLLFSTHFPGDCPPGTVDDNRRIYVDDLIKEFRTKKPDVSTISGIPVPVDDQTLALIIYTSGSTGKPKGEFKKNVKSLILPSFVVLLRPFFPLCSSTNFSSFERTDFNFFRSYPRTWTLRELPFS